jgi:hypothetical protein
MFPGNDSLPIAVLTAKERDLRPLADESAEALALDDTQAAAMVSHLQDSWFSGIRMGHRVMSEAKLGETDAASVVFSMREELQDLMESLGEGLDTTVSATIAAWDYLGRAWIAGAKFWEVEIAARLIEQEAGGFDEMLRKLSG